MFTSVTIGGSGPPGPRRFLELNGNLPYIEGGSGREEAPKVPMGIQEQAFRLYYSSMTDAKLLETAAHKSSFIGLAQEVLAEELARRNLAPPVERCEPAGAAAGPGALATLVRKLKRALTR